MVRYRILDLENRMFNLLLFKDPVCPSRFNSFPQLETWAESLGEKLNEKQVNKQYRRDKFGVDAERKGMQKT